MASPFKIGQLVELFGFTDKIQNEGAPEGELQTIDANGEKAQLVSFNKDPDHRDQWLTMTFTGYVLNVDVENIKLLSAEQLNDVDLVLGPVSDHNLAAQDIVDRLIEKGYSKSVVFSSSSVIGRVLDAVSILDFKRVPADFEPYYLGTESREKTCIVDFDDPDIPEAVGESAVRRQDERMNDMMTLLVPRIAQELGIHVQNRTNLLVRQTFEDDEEEAEYPAPATSNNAELESFMTLMKRKRLCLMHFLGPLTGKLTLTPKGKEGHVEEEVEIEVAPHSFVIFLTERYRYSFSCLEGRTTVLQSWLLCETGQFTLGHCGGDIEVLSGVEIGAPAPTGQHVAVQGIGTFLGADSKDFQCFWLAAAKAGADTVCETPITRWDTGVYCDTEDIGRAQMAGKSYTKHQGFVDGIEFFDAQFFSISKSEAGSMDPNQRKVLETGYTALHMAGFEMKDLQRNPANVGSFVGTSGVEWNQLPHAVDAAGCGSHEAILSNRLGFALNLKGMSVTVNTACSSGLVAIHMGKLQLLNKDYDRLDGSLIAALNLAYSPYAFIGCCGGAMLSWKGRCFTFDTGADGYLRGEGCGSIFLNLEQYSRDCFGLVAGSQCNQDGRSASITAPNGPSQEKCINAAFREAKVQPKEIDIFECHGTGTALGDPIEVGAFKRIYAKDKRDHNLLVSSAKTNLGHLEGGAGMSGFIKCTLQVMRAEACPGLHLRQFNGHLDVEGFPACFLSEPATCHYDSAYSGVSSFGFGGTNAHAIAYGRNVVTSRGAGQRDHRMSMRRRVRDAPPPEIMMSSADPEGWETTGMPVGEDNIGKSFQIEVDDLGKTIWRELVIMPPENPGSTFHLSGSHNGWDLDTMAQDPGVPSLCTAMLTIGRSGEETFHIVADGDASLVYYPEKPRSTRKTTKIEGPQAPEGGPAEACWLVRGTPGDSYRVEFVRTDHTTSVSWIRVRT